MVNRRDRPTFALVPALERAQKSLRAFGRHGVDLFRGHRCKNGNLE